jgi:hypothetical protein
MQITEIAFQYQTIHLASYQFYQSQIIQNHPNQSTIDEAGETLTKKHKVNINAHISWSCIWYIQEKITGLYFSRVSAE